MKSLIISLFYTVSQALIVFFKIIVNKISAIYLGAEGLGFVGILQSNFIVMKTFLNFGLNESIIKQVDCEKKINATINFIKIYIFIITVILVFLISIDNQAISKLLFGKELPILLVNLLLLSLILSFFSDINIGLLRAYGNHKWNMISSLTSNAIAVPFAFLFYYNGDVENSFFLLFVLNFSLFLLTTFKTGKYWIVNFNLINFKGVFENSLIKDGFYLMLFSIISSIYYYIIKLVINNLNGLEDVGVYHVGTTILSSYFGILIIAMFVDFYPNITKRKNEINKINEILNDKLKHILVILLPILVLFLYFIEIIIYLLFSEQFVGSVLYLEYAIYSIIFSCVITSLKYVYLLLSRSFVFLLVNLICLMFLFGALYLLIDMFSLKYIGILESIYSFILFVTLVIIGFFNGIRISKKNYIYIVLLVGICFFVNYIKYIFEGNFYIGIAIFSISTIISIYILQLNSYISQHIKNLLRV